MHLTDGRTVRPPRGAALMHDPAGKAWPKTSCLITTFSRTGKTLTDPKEEERAWATNPDAVRGGSVNAPSYRGGWKKIGLVKSIDYSRRGAHADKFEHEFKRPVPLYQKGKAMRLELGKGAQFNWRGFVDP